MISDFLNYLRRKATAYSTTGILALIIAGFIFLIWPQAALSLIFRLLRILGIILIIFGALITGNPFFLVRISGTLLALFFLIYGLISLVRQIRVEGQRSGRWLFGMAGAVFELIIGILLLAAPVSASAAVLRNGR